MGKDVVVEVAALVVWACGGESSSDASASADRFAVRAEIADFVAIENPANALSYFAGHPSRQHAARC